MNKLSLAVLASCVQRWITQGIVLSKFEIGEMENIINDGADSEKPVVNRVELETLMAHMNNGTHKIDAIRAHRALTGMGLKESKDIVERYWKNNTNSA